MKPDVPYLEGMTRETLTREQIVAAAVALLDADGLEGLNMRALGTRLGSAATAVYWHVGSKDNLITLAGDQVWNEIALPDLDAADWRTPAAALATELHAMFTRHPWVVQAFGRYPVFGPGKARHDEHCLALYEAAGFPGAQVDQAATAVFTYVLGNAVGTAAEASFVRKLGRDGGDAETAMAEMMAAAKAVAARYPRLRARLDTASADYGAAPEDSFGFGLRAVLDGLDVRRRAERAPGGTA
jgi:AcrR family transcriptional regulator